MVKNSITFSTLRHAQTTHNKNNLFTGWYNTDLTPEGIKQASILNLQPYNSIITSKHTRCIDTVTQAKATKYETDCRLNEVCLGELQGQSKTNISEYKDNPLDYTPLGGESYRMAYYRVVSLLFELYYRLQLKPQINYLLCTSSGIIRIIKALEYKPLAQDFHQIKTANCIITKHTLNINDFYYLAKL